MTAAHAGHADVEADLDRLYPGELALLLIGLCSPTQLHQHCSRPCESPGKIPQLGAWNSRALERFRLGTDRDAHLARVARHLAGGGNIGLALAPGVLALDADTPEAVEALEAVLEDAPRQDTARGSHFLVRVPVDADINATVGLELMPGVRVDIRAPEKSQIVVEPSQHAAGHAYSWRRELPEDLSRLTELPAEWLRIITAPRTSGAGTKASGGKVHEGGRNQYLFTHGCSLRARGRGEAEIRHELHLENERRCAPPLSASEVDAICENVARRYKAGPTSEADDLGAGGAGPGDRGEDGRTPRDEPNDEPRIIRLRTLSADEFERDVAPPALVASMLYAASTHTITGASKAGKTWAALQLAMAANAGMSFLGLATVATPVLYLSFELSAGMLRGRMREIEAGTGIPMPAIGTTFHVVAPTADYLPHLNLGHEEGAGELERLIGETGAKIVFLDTLYRFLPGADPNDNGAMGRIFGRVNDLAQRSGAAPVLLDHVGKGEQLGPVSHSAIGASVKGGSARVVIALRRTSREDGGRWQLDVESHFGSWEKPLYYERPRLPDGRHGGGCVPCTASEAHGLKLEVVRDLFVKHGDRCDGRPHFASKRKLREALIEAKHAGGNAQGDEAVAAILRDYCARDYAGHFHPDRPILTGDAPNNAVTFTWRTVED